MSNVRRISPPASWLIALVIASPIILPLLLPSTKLQPVRAANETHYRRDLVEFLSSPGAGDDRPRGVMLAMSGGGCAAVGPSVLAANGVEMYLTVYNDATLAHFRGLLDVLVQSKPDFIVIQDTVLVLEKRSDWLRDGYLRARTFWREKLRGVMQQTGARQLNDQEINDWRCAGWPKDRATWTSYVEEQMVRILPNSEERRTHVANFIDVFADSNIPVIIAGPPMNPYTIDYSAKMHAAARQLVDSERRKHAVSFHRQIRPMPAAHFPDPFHLSPDKNQPYRDWLDSVIKRALQERSDR